jgi:ADP-ribose pyrophosphatase YjhB (NUDIX family)
MKTNHTINKNPELISRAVIMSGRKILLCSGMGTGKYFLPGGHVEMFETSQDALERELDEELGMTVRRQVLIGIAENIYHDGRKKRHEVNLIYSVSPSSYQIESMEDDLEFSWVSINNLHKIPALPKSLFGAIIKWTKDKKQFAVYETD